MIDEPEVDGDSLVDFYRDTLGNKSKQHRFYLFEPWDVEERDPRIFEEAVKDGFNLNNPDLVAMVGKAPRLFQTGYIFDQGYIATMFASNQSGKSYAACIDALIVLTGEIPISMCHERGEVTDVPREISDNNVMRWGRRCISTGEILDHDIKVEQNHLWDCGFVTGVGIYPREKLAPAGSKVWIVTYKQARDESWWPLLKGMVPPRMRDSARSNGGFDNREHIAYLSNNSQIHFITYEQGETRLEAAGTLQEEEKLWMVLFDEEPPSSKFWATVTQRVNIIRLVTTPYKGLSWTYDDILTKAPTDEDITVYHCTKYDCPYHTFVSINRSKRTIKKWEIGARVYGLHTEASGRPYYDELFDEIAAASAVRIPYDSQKMLPNFVWDEPRELAIRRHDIEMIDAEDDDRDSWKVYEAPDPEHVYWMSIDHSDGAVQEEDAQDMHCAQILRLPLDGEGVWPIQVAVLDSSILCAEYARLCLYGCALYNNALMIPEANGRSAGTFLSVVAGWPFLYTMVITNDLTKKQTEKVGFFTSRKNRTQIFDYVGSLMKDNIVRRAFGIRHAKTIKEIAGCIVGKNGRPDHAKRGHNDALIALAIGLFVFKESREQIKNNINAYTTKKKEGWFDDRASGKKETRPMLGGKGLDNRSRTSRGGRR